MSNTQSKQGGFENAKRTLSKLITMGGLDNSMYTLQVWHIWLLITFDLVEKSTRCDFEEREGHRCYDLFEPILLILSNQELCS